MSSAEERARIGRTEHPVTVGQLFPTGRTYRVFSFLEFPRIERHFVPLVDPGFEFESRWVRKSNIGEVLFTMEVSSVIKHKGIWDVDVRQTMSGITAPTCLLRFDVFHSARGTFRGISWSEGRQPEIGKFGA